MSNWSRRFEMARNLDGLAVIESEPLQEGRNMSMLLAPSKEVPKLEDSGAADDAAPGARKAL